MMLRSKLAKVLALSMNFYLKRTLMA